VTHILGSAINKPALVGWAASEERKLVAGAAADLHAELLAELVPVQLPRAAYLSTLEARIGPARAHSKALAKAGDIGTQAHRKIEWYLRTQVGADAGPEPTTCEASEWAFCCFLGWARSVNLKPILLERTVYSTVHGYAGTLDLLARVHGVATEISLKTGKAIYNEAFLQSAAYVTALVEMGYLPPAGGSLIVRLPKVDTDPAFEVKAAPPAAELLPVFLAAKQLWTWAYANEQAYQATRKAAKVTPIRTVVAA